jgi:Flp pilus assembly protein TadD
MRGLGKISLACALVASGSAVAVLAAVPASAQGSYSPYNETPAAALARYVRELAGNPKDFNSLIGAGRAALELGDTQAAAGFFARADEVDPKSPYPQEGMGAVSVANGDPKGAMPYFTRAQQLGATQVVLGCDRGLAYDLLGQQSLAQADYRAALGGPDADEARRRLALSLAISGDKTGAIAALAPLSAKGDATTARVRAFVLALTGDSNAAMSAINAAMPGSWSRVAPFLQRLPSLPPGEKAAAVNLGIFPDSGQAAVAFAAPVRPAPPEVSMTETVSTDRLPGVDALLQNQSSAAPAQPASQPSLQAAPQPQIHRQPVQAAYAPPPRPTVAQRTDASSHEIWLQLASSNNPTALSNQFERLKSDYQDVFKGIKAYLAEGSDRSRLVIGPFRGPSDASIFADDLRSIGVDAWRWTNSESDRIVPLASE